jgi:hypothetical protein
VKLSQKREVVGSSSVGPMAPIQHVAWVKEAHEYAREQVVNMYDTNARPNQSIRSQDHDRCF